MTGLEPGVLVFAVGLGAMLAAQAPLGRFHGAALPALAWTAGLMALTWAVMIPALATERFFMPVVWIAGAAGLGIAAWRFGDLKARLRRPVIAWPEGRFARFMLAVLIAATLYNLWLICSFALSYPIIGYDAIGNYAMKAQMWLHTRELFPALLMDPEFVMYHRRYPPAIPVAEMTWAFVMGGWDDVRMKCFFLASWICVGGLMFGLLRRRNGLMTAWAAVALWVVLPYHLRELHGGATDAYPEMTHSLALMAGLALLRELGREKGWGPAALMAFVAAGSVLVKQEGLFFITLAVIYLVAIRAPWKNWAMVVAFAGANVAIWKLSGRGVPAFLDESYAQINVTMSILSERVGMLIDFARGQSGERYEMLMANRWGIALWALPVAWAYKIWRVPARRWLTLELGAAAGLAACYLAVLMNTPLDFEVHLDTTLHRLFMHILPLLMIATFDGLGEGRPLMESRLLRWMNRPAVSPTPPATPAADHAE